jgi:hypothetical protein
MDDFGQSSTLLTWDYNYFPSLYGGEYLYDNIAVNPFTFVAEHGGAGVNAAAGVGAQRAAILRAKFRESGVASEQQRLRGVRAGYGAADAAFHLEHGSALRPADVFKDRNDK